MTTEINYEQEVKKKFPTAELNHFIDPHCDSYFYIVLGQEPVDIISDTCIHSPDAAWESAYKRIYSEANTWINTVDNIDNLRTEPTKSDAEVAAELWLHPDFKDLNLGKTDFINICKKIWDAKQSDCDTSKLTRVEVIGNGREYVNMNTGNVTLSFQDEGRTLKVFVEKGRTQQSDAVKFFKYMGTKWRIFPKYGETVEQLYSQFKNEQK